MVMAFTIMLSIGLGRVLAESVEGIISAFILSAITVTLLFYVNCCQCCRRTKGTGEVAIVPGVIISACVSVTTVILSSFIIEWKENWHPVALLCFYIFYSYYLLYDLE
jgi:hypothetical protein